MAKPKLALIPASQGSKVFSVLPSDGSGDFDFSRSGSATRINSQGLIETVANGQSRLNYPMIDGKVVGCPHHILEPQRTNLLPYSEDFSGYSAPNSAIVYNYGVSPTGLLNATLIYPPSSSSNVGLYTSVSSSTVGVLSCFVKVSGKNFALLGTDNNINRYCVFDLVNETVVHEPSNYQGKIEKYKDGWYRISSTYTSSAAANFPFIGVADNSSGTVIADGSNGILIFGLQYEHEGYPTSYIPTNGSAVTRSAETANGAGNADTFNDSEGVLMAEVSALDSSDTTPKYISVGDLSDGTSALYFIIRDNSIRTIVDVLGSRNLDITKSSIDLTIPQKIAVLYKTNRFEFWYNGFLVDSALIGSVYSPNALDTATFSATSGVVPFYGNTKQLQYYNSALTDSELETITVLDIFFRYG